MHIANDPDEDADGDGESGSELESDEEDEIPQASQAPTGRRSVLGFIGGLFGRTPVRRYMSHAALLTAQL